MGKNIERRVRELEQKVKLNTDMEYRNYLMTLSDKELDTLLDESLEEILLEGESLAPEFMSQKEWEEMVREHKARIQKKGNIIKLR